MSRINSIFSLIITVMLVLPSIAQQNIHTTDQPLTEQIKIEMAIKNYKKALESENLGMVESAILNVMKLKHHYPDYDYSSLIQPLASLEGNDKSKSVRFMSYIVKNFLEHPDRYAWMERAEIEFDKDLYSVIAQKIAKQVEK